MNTYYELITFLNNFKHEKEINEELIQNFKKFNVYLEKERYNRFINHLIDTLDDRINNHFNELNVLLNDSVNANDFTNLLSNIKNEALNEIEFINVEFIKKEDQEKLLNFIKANYNEIIDRLKIKYNNYETIVNYLENCYIN